MRDHAGGVVGRGGERGELELVEVDWVEHIPSILGEKRGQSFARERAGRNKEGRNLDRVEPAERRKRDEQEDSTCGPLGKRVALCSGIAFIGYSGIWGYRLYASHFDKLVSWSEDVALLLLPGEPAISRAIVRLLELDRGASRRDDQ